MAESAPDMNEIVCDLAGETLPSGYVFALWHELVRILPWLADERWAGIVPMRGSESSDFILLPRRAKLVLRVPQERSEQLRQLTGQALDVAGHVINIGSVRSRPLQAYPTLHAHLVLSESGEAGFLSEAEVDLRRLDIDCKLICGRHVVWRSETGTVAGYSLVVHELNPDASLYLQRVGLGNERRYGCGIFVPYKAIAGLD